MIRFATWDYVSLPELTNEIAPSVDWIVTPVPRVSLSLSSPLKVTVTPPPAVVMSPVNAIGLARVCFVNLIKFHFAVLFAEIEWC